MGSYPAPRRIFLVGCPRSGTTLLQSLLAAHPAVSSFPESHFFPHVLAGRGWARRLGLISRRAPKRFDAFTTAIGQRQRIRPHLPLARVYARAFVRLLDTVARQEGKSAWVEKTPENVRCIDQITMYVPDATFIHIVRSGADVAASLYAAANTASFKGFGRPLTLDQCIERWCTDVAITRRHTGAPHHFVVRYETLVADPRAVMTRICGFLGLPADERMLNDRRAAAERVILPWEHWKAGTLEPIRNANGTKFFDALTHAEREHVLARTSAVEIPADS